MQGTGRTVVLSFTAGLSALLLAGPAPTQDAEGQKGKIPITTSSEEARQLYLEGRALAENLRATDSRGLLQQAVAKDPNFALAYLTLANTAGTAKEFFDAMNRAAAVSGKVSEPERLMILGQDAGVKGDPAGQKTHYTRLLSLSPGDERAQTAVGTYYFGLQDFPSAVEHLRKATAANPGHAPAYNMLGYSYRQLHKYPEASRPSRSTSS